MKPVASLLLALALGFVCAGCMSIPKISLPKIGKVTAPKDVGSPATLSEGTERTGMRIPANSKVTVTKTDPLPSTGVLLPGKTEWTFELPEPTDFLAEARKIQASTGTVDTTVASKRIEAQERRWLLFAAIGCGVAGLVIRSLMPAWPALSNGLFLGAILAGISWRVAELPAWMWGVGIVIALLLVAGYKRAEWDKNKDGIPDILQK